MDAVILRTERLELSTPTDADVDAIYDACQDAAVQRYVTVPSPYERTHAEGFIAFTSQRMTLRLREPSGKAARWAE